jgi:DamX protein
MSEFAAEIKASTSSAGRTSTPEYEPSLPSSANSPLPFDNQFQRVDISGIDYSDIDCCPDIPFFMGGDRRAVLDEIEHLCQFSHNLVAVLGDAGIGKTALAYQASIELSETADCCVMEASVFNSTENMLLILAQQLGVYIPEDAEYNGMVTAINQYQPVGSHQSVVIIVDAAHHLRESALQAFVQLLQKPAPNFFHVLLIGDSTLQIQLDKLDKQGALVYDIPLRAFNEDEVGHYVAFKLAQADYRGAELFNADSIQQLWRETKGIPEKINQSAREMLLIDHGIRDDERHLGLPIGYMAVVVLLLAALILAVFYIDDTPVVSEELPGAPSNIQLTGLPSSSNPSELDNGSQVAGPSRVDSPILDKSESSGVAASSSTKEAASIPDAVVNKKPVEIDSSFSVVDGLSEENTLAEISEAAAASSLVANTQTKNVTERKEVISSPPKIMLPEEPTVISLAPASTPSSTKGATKGTTKGEVAIMSWPIDGYTLQVMAAGQLDSINQFVSSQPNRDLLRVITLRRNGAPWYVVFGGVYESRDEASLAIASLPESQKNTRPWPRRIIEIQQKISDFRRK